MEEGEMFAIETFGTTGRGWVVEDLDCSHYMKDFNAPHIPLRMPRSKVISILGTLTYFEYWYTETSLPYQQDFWNIGFL